MDVVALLCNHAEAQNSLLYISGAGIDGMPVPPGSIGPWPATFAIAAQIRVPWTETNRQHMLRVDLVDSDGQAVSVPGPDGVFPFQVDMPFVAGRSPMAVEGTEQNVQVALNFAALPLPKLDVFSFRIWVDGALETQLRYRVLMPPTASFGPSVVPMM